MAEKKPGKTIGKVEIRPAPNLLKIVLIALILFSMAALLGLGWVHNGLQEQIGKLRREAAAVEQANEDLQEKIEDVGSVQSVKDIARDELGLVDPNTVIIDPQ
ncbi:MAG: septum formation initiator family protein [Oscillospiraceae bacterium]|nr:septum formation initiator family protein [Oscillospiraceae bacterium]